MDSNSKSKTLSNQFNSGFSDDDGIADEYEDDFLTDSSNGTTNFSSQTYFFLFCETYKPQTSLVLTA